MPSSSPDGSLPHPTGYRVLPAVYDLWQQSYGQDFTSQILPRLRETLVRFPVPEKRMLDAGCGTGSLILTMAQEGWEGWGIDASEGMIQECRRKQKTAPDHRAEFLCQDIRTVNLPVRVGLITSLFDVLNHLPDLPDLRTCLLSFHTTLLPHGLLVFDVNNVLCYQRLWTRGERINHPQFVLVLRNRYEEKTRTATAEVSLTLRNRPSGGPLTETVTERCYSPDEISGLLEETGFDVLVSEDFAFGTAPEFGKLKTWWVARKRGT